MEHGGVHIVNMYLVFDRMITEFIGFSIAKATFYPSAGHPHREALDVMVSPGSSFALKHGGPTKFSTPDYQSVFQHATLFEILNQGPCGLIRKSAAGVHVFFQSAMVIPSAMIKMNKAHSFLCKFPGEQTI